MTSLEPEVNKDEDNSTEPESDSIPNNKPTSTPSSKRAKDTNLEAEVETSYKPHKPDQKAMECISDKVKSDNAKSDDKTKNSTSDGHKPDGKPRKPKSVSISTDEPDISTEAEEIEPD